MWSEVFLGRGIDLELRINLGDGGDMRSLFRVRFYDVRAASRDLSTAYGLHCRGTV